jgi:hypothetical protein
MGEFGAPNINEQLANRESNVDFSKAFPAQFSNPEHQMDVFKQINDALEIQGRTE